MSTTIFNNRALLGTYEYDATATRFTGSWSSFTIDVTQTNGSLAAPTKGAEIKLNYLVTNTDLGATTSTTGLAASGTCIFTLDSDLEGVTQDSFTLPKLGHVLSGQYLYVWLTHDSCSNGCTLNVTATAAVVSGGGTGNVVYAAGLFSGTVTLTYSNGNYQYGYITNNVTFAPPIGGVEGDALEVCINYSTGVDKTLNFNGIMLPSDSAASFPKTLTQNKSYIFKLRHMGGLWCLVSLIGGFTENVD